MGQSPKGRISGDTAVVAPHRAAERQGFEARTQRFYLGEAFDNAYLDRRELEVLKLILLGLTCREIAMRLRLKPGTVSWYTDRVKQKLRCVRRSQLHGAAIRHGLVHVLAAAPGSNEH